MKKEFTEQEIIQNYIELGAYMKILCSVSVTTSTVISDYFGKTNKLHKRIQKLSDEIEQFRSDLEDEMPFTVMKALCEERGINPLDIFYGYSGKNEINKNQKQMIYDKFIKKTLE